MIYVFLFFFQGGEQEKNVLLGRKGVFGTSFRLGGTQPHLLFMEKENFLCCCSPSFWLGYHHIQGGSMVPFVHHHEDIKECQTRHYKFEKESFKQQRKTPTPLPTLSTTCYLFIKLLSLYSPLQHTSLLYTLTNYLYLWCLCLLHTQQLQLSPRIYCTYRDTHTQTEGAGRCKSPPIYKWCDE